PLSAARQLQGRTFCQHALMSTAPLVLDDVLQDPAFASVPTVRTLGIRAYADVPLVTSEGLCIGSFCAVDFRPRAWSELDIHVLSELALSAAREIALRQALAQAREASLAKSAFLADMSHEIRTPMHAVLGFAHLLERSGLTAEQQQRLGHVVNAGRHLLGVIDDILDLSKIEADRLVLEQVPFSLPTLVEEVLRLVAEPARTKHLVLQVALDDAPAWLVGDPVRLRQMLLNLASNAVMLRAAQALRAELAATTLADLVAQVGGKTSAGHASATLQWFGARRPRRAGKAAGGVAA
ncbi:MAG TPA: histidine kinase dimerization/phospho-acceptor domain-containing protein, partial [Ottowia sp.]|nr:histidine kinase dimerization/phospho-acceptor domain-containing protein [Ottowia sp.]